LSAFIAKQPTTSRYICRSTAPDLSHLSPSSSDPFC
jgi:hypothetical protein